MRFLNRLWAFLCLVPLCSFSLAAASETGFRAGVARRDVTPSEPVPMWGYGARKAALSEGMLDPLYATALVIEAGGTRAAIVGLDLGRAPREDSLSSIRRRIRDEAGIEHLFISGSHTHHGPVLELTGAEGKGQGRFDAALRYYAQMESAISEAIVEASANLVPAKFAAGSMQLEGFNRNRHTKIEPKPVDRELAVMRLDTWEGQPMAVLVNFAAHPTMIPAATLKFSSDFVGSLRQTVEADSDALLVFMQGAAGDLSVNAGENRGHEAYGSALGREVLKLFAALEPQPVRAPSLRVREEQFKFRSRTNLGNPLVFAAYSIAFFPELVANYADEYRDGIQPRLTVALLNGDVGLVGVSGEVFCTHALRLKERARLNPLFFFGYCNGYHQYFPTIEAVAEGGYGADAQVAPAEPGAGERLMDTALLWLYQMRGKIR